MSSSSERNSVCEQRGKERQKRSEQKKECV